MTQLTDRRWRALVGLLLAAAAVSACDGGTEPDSVDASVSGVWAGRAGRVANVALWRFTLTESDGQIAGTYTMLNPQFGQSFEQVALDGPVTGKSNRAAVSLEFRVELDIFATCGYEGTMAANGRSIRGSIHCRMGGARIAAGSLNLERSGP